MKLKNKMKISEEIITYETAKLALEKGFTNNVIGRKDTSVRRNYYNPEGILNGDMKVLIKAVVAKEPIDKLWNVPAPTQALLQAWLRKVHNINITIPPYMLNGKQKYSFEIFTEEVYIKIEDFEEYEYALEDALKKALKLI